MFLTWEQLVSWDVAPDWLLTETLSLEGRNDVGLSLGSNKNKSWPRVCLPMAATREGPVTPGCLSFGGVSNVAHPALSIDEASSGVLSADGAVGGIFAKKSTDGYKPVTCCCCEFVRLKRSSSAPFTASEKATKFGATELLDSWVPCTLSEWKNKSAKLELPDLSDVESMFPIDAVPCRERSKLIKQFY